MTLLRQATSAAVALSVCWAGNCAAQPAPAQTVNVPGDHYQCYRVVRAEALRPEPIAVEDQFGRARIVLARPVMLCNPSVKIHRDKRYDPKARDVHLVCYEPATKNEARLRRVRIGNQFQIADLAVAERMMFCVPSRKKLLG